MVCILTKNLRLNRILLLMLGLWPYQKSKVVQFQRISLYSIETSFIIFQLTVFVNAEWTTKDLIESFSMITLFMTVLTKYSAFWINFDNVKYLLSQLQDIYNELKDKNEISIIEKYGEHAKFYTILLTLGFILSITTLNSFITWTYILNVSHHRTNDSSNLIIKTEYFVDQEKYLYLILMHVNVATLIGGLAIVAIGALCLTFLKYTCGMFMIAGYRIEQAMMFNFAKNNVENEMMVYKNLIYAVDMHRKAMHFSTFFITSFNWTFFILMALGVFIMSLSLYRGISTGNNKEILLNFLTICSALSYIFLSNVFGQEVMDLSNYIYTTAYNVEWYTAPQKVQKLLLFLLQRSTKIFVLKVGGLFIASLENAATLTSASISYFTVLYSTNQ